MAGIPPDLFQRANEILKQLVVKQVAVYFGEQVIKLSSPKLQLSIFDAHSETFEQIRNLLEDLDINRLTPVEALIKLQEVKNLLK
jgi:DNA mismatch repair protein MutS